MMMEMTSVSDIISIYGSPNTIEVIMLHRNYGGLTRLSTDHLKQLIKKIYTRELSCPFGRSDLLMRGLNAVAEEGDLLFGLDEVSVCAVISATLAERRKIELR